MGINKFFGAGRLGGDPEFKSFPQGGGVCTFSVAFPGGREKNDATNEWDEKTTWLTCKAFDAKEGRKIGSIIQQHFGKGSEIIIDGRIEIEKWTDRDNNKRERAIVRVFDFSFCGAKKDDAGGGDGGSGGERKQQSSGSGGSKAAQKSNPMDFDDTTPDDPEGDIPF